MRKSVYTPEYRVVREELRSARIAAGLSQRELAEKLDVPHSVIAKIESGERRVDVLEFCWFIRACGVHPGPVLRRIANVVSSGDGLRRKGGRCK
jgi:transcriptional regulator with XRE-family HTH domain